MYKVELRSTWRIQPDIGGLAPCCPLISKANLESLETSVGGRLTPQQASSERLVPPYVILYPSRLSDPGGMRSVSMWAVPV